EPDILVMAAAGEPVGAVVGEQHLPHAQPVIQCDHLDVAVERVGALEIEGDGELAVALGPRDVRRRLGQHEIPRMERDPAPEVGHGADGVLPRDDMVVADVDAEVGDAGGKPTLEETQVEIGERREAAMGIPNDRIAMQVGCMWAHPFEVLRSLVTLSLISGGGTSLAAISASSHSRKARILGRSAVASGVTT